MFQVDTFVNILRDTDTTLIEAYWRTYSGRLFDVLAAESPHDRFTGADLYACALLSAPIHHSVGARLLDDDATRCTELLEQIPTDVAISDPRARHALAPTSPASELYGFLRELGGIGYVRASKLLAVKRPALVPIRDQYVEHALGAGSMSAWWDPMVELWSKPGVNEAIEDLRRRCESAVPAHVTDLRLADVAIWRSVEKTLRP